MDKIKNVWEKSRRSANTLAVLKSLAVTLACLFASCAWVYGDRLAYRAFLMKNTLKLIFRPPALRYTVLLLGTAKEANRGEMQSGSESSGISLVERAYSYGDLSLPNASSNPNNNVR